MTPKTLASTLALFLAAATGLPPVLSAAPHAGMRRIDLDHLHVWLGQPVRVTEQLGWGMDWVHPGWQPAWTFIHLTPYLARFPRGNLIATYAMDPDTQENPYFLSAFQISRDGGAHWGRRYTLLMQHIPQIFLPQPDDTLFALPSEMMETAGSGGRNLEGPAYLFEHGGADLKIVPDAVRLVDWPWPPNSESALKENAVSPQPRENWHAHVSLTGSAFRVDGKWLATIYGHKAPRTPYSLMLVASSDEGRTWRYFSTIAEGDPARLGDKGYEGPCEASIVRLADGDLMAVFRVGGTRQWHVHRAYSHDQGTTWTRPDPLPAWSVEPQLVRAANGVLTLATGRPGLYLWLSTDARGKDWQSVDLVKYHNSVVADPQARIENITRPGADHETWQTCSYTGLVETGPNRLILIYDRDAERKPAGPQDLSRVYALPIELER